MERVITKIVRYEVFILAGFLMVVGTLVKLLGIYEFSSDWFWFLAGVGLVVEGVISLIKQRKFERKFKIIEVERNEKKQSIKEQI